MNMLPIVLNLLIAQAALGAFDTIYHHELRAALPQHTSAALELRIHALRSVLYGILFAGLAWYAWHGVWLLLLAAILLAEFVLTLWDLLVEDATRLLPKSERVLHTLLAINGGAILGLLALHAPQWRAAPSALQFTFYGWHSVVLSMFAVGVTASGLRDAFASRALSKRLAHKRDFRFATSPQRILVTGGTGFIGQALCQALLADGHELTLLARSPIKAAYLFAGRVRCLSRLEELDAATRIDVVINLAGEPIVGPRWTPARKRMLAASRVDTTQSLLAWVARAAHKPRLMISASAVGYYGVQAIADPNALSESAPSQPLFVSELCQAWEGAARAVTSYGVALALLRFGLVFGHQGVLPLLRLPFMLGLGGTLGSGKQIVSWIHIDDVLGAIAHLMAIPKPQLVPRVYNVTAPHPVTQAVFAKIAGQAWHRPSKLRMPAALFRCALGEQATLLLDGQRVVPAALEHGGYRFRFPRLEAALEDLHGVGP